jgi:hypothetical protein
VNERARGGDGGWWWREEGGGKKLAAGYLQDWEYEWGRDMKK